jgi:hypothetical protein
MNTKTLGFAGCGALAAGLFMPVLSIPIVGNVTMMAQGTNWTAIALLVLAGLGAFLLLKERDAELLWPGGVACAVLLYVFGRLQWQLTTTRAQMEEALKGNPFAEIAKASLGGIQIQWGWIVLALGAGLMVYAALQARKSGEDRPRNDRVVLAVSGLALLVTPALDAWQHFRTKDAVAAAQTAAADPAGIAEAADVTEAKPSREAADYIRDNLVLYDLEAKYFNSMLDGRVPGVDFKIKNKGGRTITSLTVRVVFKDEAGKPIAEDDYYPVHVSEYGYGNSNKPLRPNYIWQQEQDQFYTAKSVPSEWKSGNATATITEIEFEKST